MHPWPRALAWRRVCDLRGVESLASDRVLAPLLEAPGAANVLAAIAKRDPSGVLAALSNALEPDLSDHLRPKGGETIVEVVARHAGCTVEDVERLRRRRRLSDAQPRHGTEFGFTCANGVHSWLGTRGLDERCPYCGEPPTRWERMLPAPYESRRMLQRRRRRVAGQLARCDATPEPPPGRGRRPGTEGKKAAARRADLDAALSASRYRPVTELIADHAARHGISHATAWRDLRRVRAR
jgi:hypothetical protein